MPSDQTPLARIRLRITGTVQGVGFRPFIGRLAARYEVAGFVINDSQGVLVEAEGHNLNAFTKAIESMPPALAKIDNIISQPITVREDKKFEIRTSQQEPSIAKLAPDAATCPSCKHDLFDQKSRFFNYPFTSCTECGPRFTIVRTLPYERDRTAMADFPLCQACTKDYREITNRRYHAETIACPECGPKLSHNIGSIAEALHNGKIVALKGIGGFHLLCDAYNTAAIEKLRKRKQRPHKPFALMVSNEKTVETLTIVSDTERLWLTSRASPIVILPDRGLLSPSIAPGLNKLGLMLAHTPMHHLLFHALEQNTEKPVALVATSANRRGVPLVIDNDIAKEQLTNIADLIVTHDRAIVVRNDDSVIQRINGKPAFIRRSRGFSLEPIELAIDGPTVLAVGGLLKNTITITRRQEAFISPHIGDLDNSSAARAHQSMVYHMMSFLAANPEAVACDLHPNFASTKFAYSLDLPVFAIQHHAAHIAATAAEHRHNGPLIGIALDGYGLGDDGGQWGGEALLLNGHGHSRRLGHLFPLPSTSGDKMAREPWRMGVSALVSLGRGNEVKHWFPTFPEAELLADLLSTQKNTTTSLGRLFDAAAALLDLQTLQSEDAYAAMRLESLVNTPRIVEGGYRIEEERLDFRPLLGMLPTFRHDQTTGAELFHGTVIAGLADWAYSLAALHNSKVIAIGGGCCMNRIIVEGLEAALAANGITMLSPRIIPANDGGISLGQSEIARALIMTEIGRNTS